MADTEKDRDLDAMLDSALAEYSAVEPRPGLEGRILGHLRQARIHRPSPWWSRRWLWAGAAAAAAVVIAILMLSSPGAKPQPAPVANGKPGSEPGPRPRVSDPTPQRAAVASPATRFARPAQVRTVAKSDPRKEVFPTPEPLSAQERMLLSYLSRTPHEEILTQSRPDRGPDEDLLQGTEGVFNPITNSRNSGNSN